MARGHEVVDGVHVQPVTGRVDDAHLLAPAGEGGEQVVELAGAAARSIDSSIAGTYHQQSTIHPHPGAAVREQNNNYRVIKPIGRGGMATVYLAEDLKHYRSVALKVLAPEIAMEVRPVSVCENVCRSTRSYRISMVSPTT